MPKIIINEYDNTKSIIEHDKNFAVVVPGIDVKGTYAFNKDGVAEFYDAKTFESEIGLSYTAKAELSHAVPTKWNTDAEDETIGTMSDAQIYKYFGHIYTRVELTENSYWPTDQKETKFDAAKNGKLISETTKEGTTTATYYGYTKVTEYENDVPYCVILDGNEGSDYEEPITHYGNQIAYELLNLGYVVFYKKISSLTELNSSDFYAPLQDRSLYNFRYILNGCKATGDSASIDLANKALAEFAHYTNVKFSSIDEITDVKRNDIIALLDIDKYYYNNKTQANAIAAIKTYINGLGDSSEIDKYSAFFAPEVTYAEGSLYSDEKEEFSGNRTLPASFHYLACAVKAFANYNPWYAVAGEDRGQSIYKVSSLGCLFGEAAINKLQPRKYITDGIKKAVNIITIVNDSYYLWGNRTAHTIGSELLASDYLNIRQLCCSLNKNLYYAGKKFSFDPNNNVLWINFTNYIKPLLDKMKADQGIEDYKILKIKSEAKALLSAKVRIVPIEAVEDFYLNVYLENSLDGFNVEEDE